MFKLRAFGLAASVLMLSACATETPTAPTSVDTAAAVADASGVVARGSSDAAEIRVRCEVRNGQARSKISVDGKNLAAGSYRARVTSGGSSVTSAPQAAVGDEAEFDFDSNRNDIAQGATEIPANFINNATVRGEILSALGATVLAATVQCEVR